jgi:hypothetical protein
MLHQLPHSRHSKQRYLYLPANARQWQHDFFEKGKGCLTDSGFYFPILSILSSKAIGLVIHVWGGIRLNTFIWLL